MKLTQQQLDSAISLLETNGVLNQDAYRKNEDGTFAVDADGNFQLLDTKSQVLRLQKQQVPAFVAYLQKEEIVEIVEVEEKPLISDEQMMTLKIYFANFGSKGEEWDSDISEVLSELLKLTWGYLNYDGEMVLPSKERYLNFDRLNACLAGAFFQPKQIQLLWPPFKDGKVAYAFPEGIIQSEKVELLGQLTQLELATKIKANQSKFFMYSQVAYLVFKIRSMPFNDAYVENELITSCGVNERMLTTPSDFSQDETFDFLSSSDENKLEKEVLPKLEEFARTLEKKWGEAKELQTEIRNIGDDYLAGCDGEGRLRTAQEWLTDEGFANASAYQKYFKPDDLLEKLQKAYSSFLGAKNVARLPEIKALLESEQYQLLRNARVKILDHLKPKLSSGKETIQGAKDQLHIINERLLEKLVEFKESFFHEGDGHFNRISLSALQSFGLIEELKPEGGSAEEKDPQVAAHKEREVAFCPAIFSKTLDAAEEVFDSHRLKFEECVKAVETLNARLTTDLMNDLTTIGAEVTQFEEYYSWVKGAGLKFEIKDYLRHLLIDEQLLEPGAEGWLHVKNELKALTDEEVYRGLCRKILGTVSGFGVQKESVLSRLKDLELLGFYSSIKKNPKLAIELFASLRLIKQGKDGVPLLDDRVRDTTLKGIETQLALYQENLDAAFFPHELKNAEEFWKVIAGGLHITTETSKKMDQFFYSFVDKYALAMRDTYTRETSFPVDSKVFLSNEISSIEKKVGALRDEQKQHCSKVTDWAVAKDIDTLICRKNRLQLVEAKQLFVKWQQLAKVPAPSAGLAVATAPQPLPLVVPASSGLAEELAKLNLKLLSLGFPPLSLDQCVEATEPVIERRAGPIAADTLAAVLYLVQQLPQYSYKKPDNFTQLSRYRQNLADQNEVKIKTARDKHCLNYFEDFVSGNTASLTTRIAEDAIAFAAAKKDMTVSPSELIASPKVASITTDLIAAWLALQNVRLGIKKQGILVSRSKKNAQVKALAESKQNLLNMLNSSTNDAERRVVADQVLARPPVTAWQKFRANPPEDCYSLKQMEALLSAASPKVALDALDFYNEKAITWKVAGGEKNRIKLIKLAIQRGFASGAQDEALKLFDKETPKWYSSFFSKKEDLFFSSKKEQAVFLSELVRQVSPKNALFILHDRRDLFEKQDQLMTLLVETMARPCAYSDNAAPTDIEFPWYKEMFKKYPEQLLELLINPAISPEVRTNLINYLKKDKASTPNIYGYRSILTRLAEKCRNNPKFSLLVVTAPSLLTEMFKSEKDIFNKLNIAGLSQIPENELVNWAMQLLTDPDVLMAYSGQSSAYQSIVQQVLQALPMQAMQRLKNTLVGMASRAIPNTVPSSPLLVPVVSLTEAAYTAVSTIKDIIDDAMATTNKFVAEETTSKLDEINKDSQTAVTDKKTEVDKAADQGISEIKKIKETNAALANPNYPLDKEDGIESNLTATGTTAGKTAGQLRNEMIEKRLKLHRKALDQLETALTRSDLIGDEHRKLIERYEVLMSGAISSPAPMTKESAKDQKANRLDLPLKFLKETIKRNMLVDYTNYSKLRTFALTDTALTKSCSENLLWLLDSEKSACIAKFDDEIILFKKKLLEMSERDFRIQHLFISQQVLNFQLADPKYYLEMRDWIASGILSQEVASLLQSTLQTNGEMFLSNATTKEKEYENCVSDQEISNEVLIKVNAGLAAAKSVGANSQGNNEVPLSHIKDQLKTLLSEQPTEYQKKLIGIAQWRLNLSSVTLDTLVDLMVRNGEGYEGKGRDVAARDLHNYLSVQAGAQFKSAMKAWQQEINIEHFLYSGQSDVKERSNELLKAQITLSRAYQLQIDLKSLMHKFDQTDDHTEIEKQFATLSDKHKSFSEVSGTPLPDESLSEEKECIKKIQEIVIANSALLNKIKIKTRVTEAQKLIVQLHDRLLNSPVLCVEEDLNLLKNLVDRYEQFVNEAPAEYPKINDSIMSQAHVTLYLNKRENFEKVNKYFEDLASNSKFSPVAEPTVWLHIKNIQQFVEINHADGCRASTLNQLLNNLEEVLTPAAPQSVIGSAEKIEKDLKAIQVAVEIPMKEQIQRCMNFCNGKIAACRKACDTIVGYMQHEVVHGNNLHQLIQNILESSGRQPPESLSLDAFVKSIETAVLKVMQGKQGKADSIELVVGILKAMQGSEAKENDIQEFETLTTILNEIISAKKTEEKKEKQRKQTADAGELVEALLATVKLAEDVAAGATLPLEATAAIQDLQARKDNLEAERIKVESMINDGPKSGEHGFKWQDIEIIPNEGLNLVVEKWEEDLNAANKRLLELQNDLMEDKLKIVKGCLVKAESVADTDYQKNAETFALVSKRITRFSALHKVSAGAKAAELNPAVPQETSKDIKKAILDLGVALYRSEQALDKDNKALLALEQFYAGEPQAHNLRADVNNFSGKQTRQDELAQQLQSQADSFHAVLSKEVTSEVPGGFFSRFFASKPKAQSIAPKVATPASVPNEQLSVLAERAVQIDDQVKIACNNQQECVHEIRNKLEQISFASAKTCNEAATILESASTAYDKLKLALTNAVKIMRDLAAAIKDEEYKTILLERITNETDPLFTELKTLNTQINDLNAELEKERPSEKASQVVRTKAPKAAAAPEPAAAPAPAPPIVPGAGAAAEAEASELDVVRVAPPPHSKSSGTPKQSRDRHLSDDRRGYPRSGKVSAAPSLAQSMVASSRVFAASPMQSEELFPATIIASPLPNNNTKPAGPGVARAIAALNDIRKELNAKGASENVLKRLDGWVTALIPQPQVAESDRMVRAWEVHAEMTKYVREQLALEKTEQTPAPTAR